MKFGSGRPILILSIIFLCIGSIYAGPPDNNIPYEDLQNKQLEDSLEIAAQKLSHIAESLSLRFDSLKYLHKSFEDITNLPSFREIIIDEKGVIKVLTDSGFVTLSADSIFFPDNFDDLTRPPGEITRWGKSIIVDEDEQLISDIVIISGDVTVNGMVQGDVVVIGGNIYVNSTGYIRGDATAIGGHVKKEEGAKITGSSVSIGLPFMVIPRGSWMQVFEVILLFTMAISLFFSALSISLFPGPVRRIATQLVHHPIKSFLLGYVFYIGSFIVWLLLLVSVIGIPLALIGQPIAMIIVTIFGYAAINIVLGDKIFKEQSSVKSLLYGYLITTAAPFILLLAGYLTNLLVFFIINMILLSFLLFILLPFGLGAAILARFGLPRRSKKADFDDASAIVE
jgi:hypothetical protein